jgi:hypothetical protein
MPISNLTASLTTFVCLSCYSALAVAQAAAGQPAAAPVAAAPAVATAPAVAPAPAPPSAVAPLAPAAAPVAVVPPGYALVPIDNGAQTRYDVEYPQNQGALPPGMELPYEEGQPVPPGYRVVKQSRRGLVIAGSIVGGISYGFSIMGAVEDDFNHSSGALLVPVLGPWIMLAAGGAKNGCTASSTSTYDYSYCDPDKSSLRAMLVLDGLTQAAGAAMFTIGLAYPRTRLVRNDVTVSMAPMPFGRDGYGIGAVGQF